MWQMKSYSAFAGTRVEGISGDGGLAINATFSDPTQIAVNQRGNLYIAAYRNIRIRKMDRHGIITTMAGTGVAGFNGVHAVATKAMLNTPRRLTMNPAGDVLYIADTDNHRIRRIALR